MSSFLAFLPFTAGFALLFCSFSQSCFSFLTNPWPGILSNFSLLFWSKQSSLFAYHFGPSRKTVSIHIYIYISRFKKTQTNNNKKTPENQHLRSFEITCFCACIFVEVYNDNDGTCQCIKPGCVMLKRLDTGRVFYCLSHCFHKVLWKSSCTSKILKYHK